MATSSSRTKRVLIGSVVVTLVTAACLEGGARLIDRVRGDPFDAEAGRAAIRDAVRKLANSWVAPRGKDEPEPEPDAVEPVIVQPYTAWEHPRTQVQIVEDRRYYPTPIAEQTYDVCILGGSVAQIFGDMGGKSLTGSLQRDPRFQGRPVRVHNYALAGYKQPQQAAMLSYLFAMGHKPDAVVNIDGFNEAALGWKNAKLGAHPLYPHVAHWAEAVTTLGSAGDTVEYLYAVRTKQLRARSFGKWFLDSGLWHSCFLYHTGYVALRRLRKSYERAYASLMDRIADSPENPGLHGPAFDPEDTSVARAILVSWMESSTNIQGMCSQRGIPYLHVLQPTLHDTGSKTLTAKEIETSRMDPIWMEGVHVMYPRFRKARNLLESRGIRFLDASGLFRDHPEDVYFDCCHFAEHGNEILGDAIGAELARIDRR